MPLTITRSAVDELVGRVMLPLLFIEVRSVFFSVVFFEASVLAVFSIISVL